jgi:hypothetical protein
VCAEIVEPGREINLRICLDLNTFLGHEGTLCLETMDLETNLHVPGEWKRTSCHLKHNTEITCFANLPNELGE